MIAIDPTIPASPGGAGTPDEDARRLAEIANDEVSAATCPWPEVQAIAKRLLDTKPQGEFVTRAKYDDLLARFTSQGAGYEAAQRVNARWDIANTNLATALAASEARNAELQQSEARMRAIVDLTMEMIEEMRLTPEGLIVKEKRDNSDAHYRLCGLLWPKPPRATLARPAAAAGQREETMQDRETMLRSLVKP